MSTSTHSETQTPKDRSTGIALSEVMDTLHNGLLDKPEIKSAQGHDQPSSLSILPNVLSLTGNTPMFRLNRIPAFYGIKCEVSAKCEFFGPSGSHKDRSVLQMIEDAERSGSLKPGYTIIEPTSGNTGISIALVSAVKGYSCIFVVPENRYSEEKCQLLRALGAEIVKGPLETSSPVITIEAAQELQKTIPNSILLNQFDNPGNQRSHYTRTGHEILQQCDGKIDMFVTVVGTGGSISGIGKRIKEVNPHCKIIGVDLDSELQGSHERSAWEVDCSRMYDDFLPGNLDASVIDHWYQNEEKAGEVMAKKILQEEGLLIGKSSGSALICALQAIQDAGLGEGQRCVVMFSDGIRNYMNQLPFSG